MSARTEQPSSESPVQQFSFSSKDEDEITEFMSNMYVGNRSQFAPALGKASFDNETAEAPGIAADDIRSTIDYSQTTEPFDYLLSFLVRGGMVHLESRGDGAALHPGDVALCPVGSPVHFDMSDMHLSVVRIPMTQIETVAEEVSAVPAAQFRFEGMLPVSPAMHRYWRSVTGLARAALMPPEPAMSADLLRTETIRSVALAALHTFPNTAMGQRHHAQPGEVGPAAVRRAIAYIDANAHLPLTLADISAAARTSSRALQYGFRRYYETTPMGYLRRVRLERAHREIQGADPTAGDTVAAIAARWGFGKPSRFAAVYRDAFGIQPNQTLRT